MGNAFTFQSTFRALTGNDPFPWQAAIFDKFVAGDLESVRTCSIPTGLGKTSVIAAWLIALSRSPEKLPRRLVYVVNRRTVVDQTTNEVERLRRLLIDPESGALRELASRLSELSATGQPLAISTLRGQFADNQEWSADPARPAVICGTVDMIGSRLLFSGYGLGFRSKPLHAGFLGHDALLVHDEAHLEPAFQVLLESVVTEQISGRTPDFDPDRRLKVIELTATTRTGSDSFGLGPDDLEHSIVFERMHAVKTLQLHPLDNESKLSEQLTEHALKHRESGRAVLVFARTVDVVEKVADLLKKKVGDGSVKTLTGTMRGKERDELVRDAVFVRFLPHVNDGEALDDLSQSVYLICTSAGEVGVNISADHLVCDLTTFESMVQRFGRVNRFGRRTDTCIDVVHPTTFGKADKLSPYDERRNRTLVLLKELTDCASPHAISQIPVDQRIAAFSPDPVMLPATDILFDAWSLTTIRGKLPGRPPVEPYLHGLPTEWQPPETRVAWREEVAKVVGELLGEYPPEELLEDYPLKPHEFLKIPSSRAFDQFKKIAERRPEEPVWLVDDLGSVDVKTIALIADKDHKDLINGKLVLLPPEAGGLSPEGMLNGAALDPAEDVADEWYEDQARRVRRRKRVRVSAETPIEPPEGMRLIRRIEFNRTGGDDEQADDSWLWFERFGDGGLTSRQPVEWRVHVDDVVQQTTSILSRLHLPTDIQSAVEFAARFHDHGKQRKRFQLSLGNSNPDVVLAKSGKRGLRLPELYRHEFGSLLECVATDTEARRELLKLSEQMQDLALHLIAAHHGRARPHFPIDERLDPEPPPGVSEEAMAIETPRRFARLQRRYGRWGLAYLESLLRAADWAASAAPSQFFGDVSSIETLSTPSGDQL